jgi:hypothetical protein
MEPVIDIDEGDGELVLTRRDGSAKMRLEVEADGTLHVLERELTGEFRFRRHVRADPALRGREGRG